MHAWRGAEIGVLSQAKYCSYLAAHMIVWPVYICRQFKMGNMGGTNTEANCTMTHGMLPARGMRCLPSPLYPHPLPAAAVSWPEQLTVRVGLWLGLNSYGVLPVLDAVLLRAVVAL